MHPGPRRATWSVRQQTVWAGVQARPWQQASLLQRVHFPQANAVAGASAFIPRGALGEYRLRSAVTTNSTAFTIEVSCACAPRVPNERADQALRRQPRSQAVPCRRLRPEKHAKGTMLDVPVTIGERPSSLMLRLIKLQPRICRPLLGAMYCHQTLNALASRASENRVQLSTRPDIFI